MLRKAPRFNLLVALILALGIGANTSICTPVNAALLGPLPYQDSSRLCRWRRIDRSGVSKRMAKHRQK
jgi:hypothetical protein